MTTYSGFWNPRATDGLLAVMSAAADASSYDFDTLGQPTSLGAVGTSRFTGCDLRVLTGPTPPSMAV